MLFLITTEGAKTGLADGIVITPSHNPPMMAVLNTTLLTEVLCNLQ